MLSMSLTACSSAIPTAILLYVSHMPLLRADNLWKTVVYEKRCEDGSLLVDDGGRDRRVTGTVQPGERARVGRKWLSNRAAARARRDCHSTLLAEGL